LNLVTAAMLAHTTGNFASYQVITTLLGSLAAIPLQLLARQAGGRAAARWVVPMLMISPLFIENATYPWTKLGSAAFVLVGIFFYLRAWSSNRTVHWLFAALALTGGVLGHYSAAPYLVIATIGYAWRHRASLTSLAFGTKTARVGLATIALAGTWFGWALVSRGWSETLGANTSVQQFHALTWPQRVGALALNLERTLLPPPWPKVDTAFLRHRDPLATLRYHAFVFYQTCLPGMIGLGGFSVLIAWLLRNDRSRLFATRDQQFAWLGGIALVGLCVAVHPAPVRWGVGHICLQPAALAGIAWAAALFVTLPSGIRRLALAGFAIDGALGVALHLKLEHLAISIQDFARENGTAVRELYGLAFQQNTAAKHALGLVLVGDGKFAIGPAVALMALVLVLAFYRAFTAGCTRAVASASPNMPGSALK
jgi:hypothetical protein